MRVTICILSPFKCCPYRHPLFHLRPRPRFKAMASIQFTASGQTESAKTADVGRDVVDPTQGNLNYLTSDQGVKISDTDNW